MGREPYISKRKECFMSMKFADAQRQENERAAILSSAYGVALSYRRLQKLLLLQAPETILDNEKKLLANRLKVFDKNLLYITKPLGQRFWTRTAALNDADEIAGSILLRPAGKRT